MKKESKQIILLCISGTSPPPLPTATVTHCRRCGDKVWVAHSSPKEALPHCFACVSIIAPRGQVPLSEKQRQEIRNFGISDAGMDQVGKLVDLLFVKKE